VKQADGVFSKHRFDFRYAHKTASAFAREQSTFVGLVASGRG